MNKGRKLKRETKKRREQQEKQDLNPNNARSVPDCGDAQSAAGERGRLRDMEDP